MTRLSVLAVAALLSASCGGQGSGASGSPRATASPSSSAQATLSPPPSATPLAGAFGLLLTAGELELVRPDASIAAGVAVANASVQYCSSQHDGAVLAPPVSASNDQVYFRDGDTKIRMVVPPASAADVTTVPGSSTVVSFFSVSPDDQRIAVLVEDLSGASTIGLRLYVEDLHGGGHHSDIYTASTPKAKLATTLWPMGWHQGALVLALMPACTFEPAGLTPSEWHVSNVSNGARIATIRAAGCTLSYWPSPAGVGCINAQGVTTLFDWSGKVTSVTGPPTAGVGYVLTGVSPAGQSAFFSTGAAVGAPAPTTQILQLGPGPYATVQGHSACTWIDEDHLLAQDAVIQFPAETPGNLQVTATATALSQSGECAGRFPGGL
ncbi:MAG TPA: hypothetical protein VLU92_10780 [Candidatus Dormibacteraeota bacterium]|nr:hypothetical protein [Candidatus Dormibacteraeota bacterium]